MILLIVKRSESCYNYFLNWTLSRTSFEKNKKKQLLVKKNKRLFVDLHFRIYIYY